MAIKERKQITGTTEQINAYEGHEGQIVWDKDKKTFVGMSGTAGKNYPLAQQAYVDTQFLPLSGGILTGNIIFNTGAILSGMSQDGTLRELLLGSDALEDSSNNSGAYIALRNHGGSLDDLRGSFAIHTRLADTTIPYFLEGKTNGDLRWSGQTIDSYVDIKYQAHPSGGGLLCYRCRSGLQFMFGGIVVGENRTEHLVFPYPFINTGYAIACHGVSPWPDIVCSTDSKTTTSVLIKKGSIDKSQNFITTVQIIIFGNWK